MYRRGGGSYIFFRLEGYSSSSQVMMRAPIFSNERSSFSTLGFQSNLRKDSTTFGPMPSTRDSFVGGVLKTLSGLPKASVRRLNKTLPTPGAKDKATQW
jgi:hypothetical protein